MFDTSVTVELPATGVRLTVFPLTGCPPVSLSVTVTVEVLVPFASTFKGAAVTVDVPALTAPIVKLTPAVCVIGILSVTSFAV